MTTPTRISALHPITPEQEQWLAHELLQIQSEEELDRFIPLLIPAIKAAAPLLMNLAGPLLKGVAGSLFGQGQQPRPRPRSQQEQFLGSLLGKLFGAGEVESEEEQQFLGSLLGGLLGSELEAEEEQLLGDLLGKLFGGELEASPYVQEQFIGQLARKVAQLARRSVKAVIPGQSRLPHARIFVRLATLACRRAAAEIMRLIQSGQQPTEHDVCRIIVGAMIEGAHRSERRSASGSATEPTAMPSAPHDQTLLQHMTAGARPLGGS